MQAIKTFLHKVRLQFSAYCYSLLYFSCEQCRLENIYIQICKINTILNYYEDNVSMRQTLYKT